MDSDFNEGFFSLDQLLMEEGLVASSIGAPAGWENVLVREEKKDLSEEQKKNILYTLLGMKYGNKLEWGAISKVAKQYGVHKGTVSRLWNQHKENLNNGRAIDVRNKKKGSAGRKPTHANSEEWLHSVPLHLRGSYRSYAGALKCSHTHIYRLLKKGVLRAHTSPNRPNVSEANKIERMKWVLAHIIPGTATEKAKFIPMQHTVHIDEKWFYLNPGTRRFYMLPSEVDPYRTTKSKNYSIKVMFMGVTSRPIYDEDGKLLFDGKFGIFPFVVKERAKRKSKNRDAGTLETKVVKNVNQNVTRKMMLEKVLPCIREKWPTCLSKDINIQQDNARPHLKDNDPEFREEASKEGFNMHLVNQPPQSPDFNVLDLALFRALQSLQYHSFPKDIDELIVKVNEVYEAFDPTLIKYAWITLQYCMVEALRMRGGNNYKIPHINKQRLDRLGVLEEQMEVDQAIVDDAVSYLNQRNAAAEEMDEEDFTAYYEEEEE